MSKLPQIHASALEMKCMEAFRRRYIEGDIIPPGVAMIVGTGTHKSVERNLTAKIETGDLLPLDMVADAARDGVNNAWESGVRLDDTEVPKGIKQIKGEAVDAAVRLSVLHATRHAPRLQPTHVERQWSLKLPGYEMELVGRLDIQEGKSSVRDTKTSAKTPPADCADRSLQLQAYALAVQVLDGELPARVYLDYLINTKTSQVAVFGTDPDYTGMRSLLNRIEALIIAMQRGVFMPVEPTHWCCSPKWCGYHGTCKYVRQPISINITEAI